MTASELQELVGMAGTLEISTTQGTDARLIIGVKVLDAREAWGRTDLLVTPEAGQGQAWVSADRVKVRGR